MNTTAWNWPTSDEIMATKCKLTGDLETFFANQPINSTIATSTMTTTYPSSDFKMVGNVKYDTGRINISPLPGAGTTYPTDPQKAQIEKDMKKLLTVPARKFDDGKTRWDLVPFEALEGMVDVLVFGAKKYDEWNWQADGGFSHKRLLNSALRHQFAYLSGQDNDPESGMCHLYHAQCCLLFVTHYLKYPDKFPKDDRRK